MKCKQIITSYLCLFQSAQSHKMEMESKVPLPHHLLVCNLYCKQVLISQCVGGNYDQPNKGYIQITLSGIKLQLLHFYCKTLTILTCNGSDFKIISNVSTAIFQQKKEHQCPMFHISFYVI